MRIASLAILSKVDSEEMYLAAELCDAIFFRHTEGKFHVLRVHSNHGEIEVSFVSEGDVAADSVPIRITRGQAGGGNRDLESTANSVLVNECEVVEQRRVRNLDNQSRFALGKGITQRFILERERGSALSEGFLLVQKEQEQRGQDNDGAAAPIF